MASNFDRALGPYSVIFKMVVVAVFILGTFRLGLAIWQWERVSAVASIWQIIVYGLRSDLIMTGMLFSPLVLLAPLLANNLSWKLWKTIILIWGVAGLSLLIFMELATPTFILEYDLRPNRLFIEYLKYPSEVGAMLWKGFRTPLILGLGLTALGSYISFRIIRSWLENYESHWSVLRTFLIWPLVVILFIIMVRSSFTHRPANPALFARTPDAMVNSLFINSAWSVYFAIYNLQHEDKSSEIYGDLSLEEIMEIMRQQYPWLDSKDKTHPTLHFQNATQTRSKPLNLVIILEESLGAEFVESLGGKPLTPNLEKLSEEGWWFENMYATGTRSVRGIEAVISGYPPTPARSVVKLSLAQQNFFTLADYLNDFGYHSEFVYGGESHFDNMANFFIGNGFDDVIDERDYENPRFMGSWGASDQDLFDKAHERISSLSQENKPFMSFIFSSSNHSPYEYPDNVIESKGTDKFTRENAVLYSDYAIGEFIQKAKKSPYWENTLFLIVADHTSHADGDSLVPIEDFHIPGLILGADIEPKKITSITSQIDLAPTLLSLMGISGNHPMIGRDLSKKQEQNSDGRALLQFSDYFALLQGNKVTVLRPDQPAMSGMYDTVTGSINDLVEADDTTNKVALAHSLLPSLLYREQKYQGSKTNASNR